MNEEQEHLLIQLKKIKAQFHKDLRVLGELSKKGTISYLEEFDKAQDIVRDFKFKLADLIIGTSAV